MSWLGSHPVISKQEAKHKLVKGACKMCVYYYRVFKETRICYRCQGVKQ